MSGPIRHDRLTHAAPRRAEAGRPRNRQLDRRDEPFTGMDRKSPWCPNRRECPDRKSRWSSTVVPGELRQLVEVP